MSIRDILLYVILWICAGYVTLWFIDRHLTRARSVLEGYGYSKEVARQIIRERYANVRFWCFLWPLTFMMFVYIYLRATFSDD